MTDTSPRCCFARLLLARFLLVGRHEFVSVGHFKFACVLVVLTAKRVDVPFLVRAPAALLNVCPDNVCLHATTRGAVGGLALTTEFLPVFKPGATLAGGVGCPVDVSDLHLFFSSLFVLAECPAATAHPRGIGATRSGAPTLELWGRERHPQNRSSKAKTFANQAFVKKRRLFPGPHKRMVGLYLNVLFISCFLKGL